MIKLTEEVQTIKDSRARKVIDEYIRRNSGGCRCSMRKLSRILQIPKSTIGTDLQRSEQLEPEKFILYRAIVDRR